MTPEAQRIAIAEACGWIEARPATCVQGQVSGIPPKNVSPTQLRDWVPDYLHDLNAIHQAEMMLDKDQLWDFASKLSCVMDAAPRRFNGMAWEAHHVSPTAPQRCEAFLRTLNLWDDSK